MQVVVPVPDFQFESTSTSPYVSAPSSPKHFGDPFDHCCHYTSAPTSPTRASAIYAHFNMATFANNTHSRSISSSVIPFDWEEKPGTPKSKHGAAAATSAKATEADSSDEFDFAFDFSGQLEKGGMPPAFSTADELFEEGKIRPLKPPPRLYQPTGDDIASSPRSPKSPRSNGFWSPRNRGREGHGQGLDPFTVALDKATRQRGRERAPSSPSISAPRSRKGSRSLSPLRGVGGLFPTSSPLPPSGGSKKWRLRDLFLFRSASEGRVTGNKSKYTMPSSSSSSLLSSQQHKRGVGGEDSRNSSFRSTASNGSVRGASVSPHQMHYAANKAASQELKKKTPLPYKQSLFACLRFNPAVNSIAKSFNRS